MRIDARWHATLERDIGLLRRLERLARRRADEAKSALVRLLGPEEFHAAPLTRAALAADPTVLDARERFRAAHRARCEAADDLAAIEEAEDACV